MADRLNKVYAEGLTRFETRGRSTSAVPSTNVDHILGKYGGVKDFIPASKRLNLESATDKFGMIGGVGKEGLGRISTAEKEAMSRSIDRFLPKGNSDIDVMRLRGAEYPSDLSGLFKNREEHFNHPSISQFRGTDVYNKMSKFQDLSKFEGLNKYQAIGKYQGLGKQSALLNKYEGLGRFDKIDTGSNIYSKQYGMNSSSQNYELIKKQLQLKGLTNDIGVKERNYHDELGLYKNQQDLDSRFGINGYEPQTHPRSFKQFEEPRRQTSSLFGNRQFGKQINRDFTRQFQYGKSLGKGYSNTQNKDLLTSNFTRPAFSKDYSAMLSTQNGLGRPKASELSRNIGKDFSKGLQTKLSNRYDNLRRTSYNQSSTAGLRQNILGSYKGNRDY